MTTVNGWKIINQDGTSWNKFPWPLVNASAGQAPVRVEATGWTERPPFWRDVADDIAQGGFTTEHSCPQFRGDGLCIAKTAWGASSGGISLTRCIGLILTYDTDDILYEGHDKVRVKACNVVDTWSPLEVIRKGGSLIEAGMWDGNLTGAYLAGADLNSADLRGVDMRNANIQAVNFTNADLRGCNFTEAKSSSSTIWPENFKPRGAGVMLVPDGL